MTVVADTPTQASAPAEEPKKSKKKLFIIIGVVVLLLAAVAHFTVLKKKPSTAVAKPVAGKILKIKTQTLNLADGHLLQVGLGLQLTTTADSASIVAKEPKIDNLTLRVLSPYTYHQLLHPKLRNQAQRRLGKGIAAMFNPKPPKASPSAKTSPAAKGSAKKSVKSAKAGKTTAKKGSTSKKTTPTVAAPPQVLKTFFTTFLMQ